MKTEIIHTPYRSYNRREDKWKWTVEVFFQELITYTFNTEEEAKKFKKEKELLLNESK